MGQFDLNRMPQLIDHTLLKANAGQSDIVQLCRDAIQYQFHSVCVNSGWVSLCADSLQGSSVRIAAVCGFPLGAGITEVKAYEAQQAVAHGASEIDMVLPIGILIDGHYATVRTDVEKVVLAVKDQAIVKVILETGYLTDEQKTIGCRLAEEAGAHFVKTSTGFGAGGATVEDVRLMRQSVSPHIGVKASGGIRDLQTAIQMIEAGATRLGTSSGVSIMKGISGSAEY